MAAKTIFTDGEAERLVETLQNHLQAASDATSDGKLTLAKRNKEKAEAIFEQIRQRLRTRFEKYAKASFPGREDIQEDAIAVMASKLYQDLMGDPTESTFYATRFNKAVQVLIIDAIREVRPVNGFKRETGEVLLLTYR